MDHEITMIQKLNGCFLVRIAFVIYTNSEWINKIKLENEGNESAHNYFIISKTTQPIFAVSFLLTES